MSGKLKKLKNHPAEKSLSIFPIIPRKKSGVVATSMSSTVLSKKSKYESNCANPKVRVTLRNSMSPSAAIEPGEKTHLRQSLQRTKSKLNEVTRHLPVVVKSSTQFPPINRPRRNEAQCVNVPGTRQIPHEEHSKGYKAFILPVLVDSKPQSVQQQRVRRDIDDLSNRKLKEISKRFRPEETPPLFSIYVRWKNNRDGTVEYNQNTLVEVFQNFGQISNIIFKSRSSAIIVYMQIESAGKAVAVMQKIGKDMKLHVLHLSDMI